MSTLLAMAAFSLVMSILPGPVNLITLSIGASRGYRKALPFVSGATIGFTLLLFIIGTGLGEFLQSAAFLMNALSIIGTALICYIGMTIALSDGSMTAVKDESPGFIQGFLLQWLNPKAWAACFAGVAIFTSKQSSQQLYTFVTVYFFVCFTGIACWAIAGEKALIALNNPLKIRRFNQVIGISLISIALFMLYQQLYGS